MKQTQILYQIPLIIFLGFLILTLSPALADQTKPVGKVVAVRNNVTATGQDAVLRKLVLKSPVFLHDTIKTNSGRIQMMFKDNTIITLGRNAEIIITKYLWEPGNTDSTMETQINEGSFRIMGGAITRIAPENFKTITPSGTIGIRGSMYAGMLKSDMLSVVFQGGKGIYVKNQAGMVNITIPGFATRVKNSTVAPETPAKLSSDDLIELENALASTPEEKPEQTDGTDTTTEAVVSEPSSPKTSSSGDVLSDASDIALLSETTSVINDAALTSVQTDKISSNPSTDTQQTILSILQDLGFSGTESTSIPSTGIWSYFGKIDNNMENDTPDNLKYIVNWDNQRIMVLEDFSTEQDHNSHGFGFGDVNSSGSISNMKIFGSGSDVEGETIIALTGYETFGSFYGSNQGGVGLAMEGYDYNVPDQTVSTFWSDITAGTVKNKKTNIYSGNATWKGFFVGIAEDMAAPDISRRAFFNSNPDDFLLSINKDSGTFSGTMSGSDFNDSNNLISNISIGGGSTESAYISDKLFAASLSGNSVITISNSTGGLKTHGNFMVTSNETHLSNHTIWGYWEVAYAEPGTTKDYHIHIPGSQWIAGTQTLPTTISDLRGANFTGTYTGGAKGVMFDSFGQMKNLSSGSTSLNINFASTASLPVSGNISFDQVTLPVTSFTGDLTSTGFQATISGAAHSSVNGTFFGANADGIGGNFSAEITNGVQYHGIFAGDR